MIELRWFNYTEEQYHDGIPIASMKRKRVLQYRTMENPLEHGLQEPLWSDWQDVPEVFDTTKEQDI